MLARKNRPVTKRSMTSLLAHHHLAVALAVFLLAAALIAVFGVRMTYLARDLAVATRLGEAVIGAVLIGAPPPCRSWW